MSTRGRVDVSSSQKRSQGEARVGSSGHGAGCGSSRFSGLGFFFFRRSYRRRMAVRQNSVGHEILGFERLLDEVSNDR